MREYIKPVFHAVQGVFKPFENYPILFEKCPEPFENYSVGGCIGMQKEGLKRAERQNFQAENFAVCVGLSP